MVLSCTTPPSPTGSRIFFPYSLNQDPKIVHQTPLTSVLSVEAFDQQATWRFCIANLEGVLFLEGLLFLEGVLFFLIVPLKIILPLNWLYRILIGGYNVEMEGYCKFWHGNISCVM